MYRYIKNKNFIMICYISRLYFRIVIILTQSEVATLFYKLRMFSTKANFY